MFEKCQYFKHRIILILILLLLSCTSSDAPAPLISVEDFFRNPQRSNVKISPDGEYIALLQPWKTRKNIFVHKIGGNDIERITDAVNRDINAYMWANDERIVFVQDYKGDENFQLYAVDYNGRNEKQLTSFEDTRIGLIDPLTDNDDEMLIAMNKRDKTLFDIYRIDINTGVTQLVAQNPGHVIQWLSDHNGTVRIAIAKEGLHYQVLYRNSEKEQFQEILRFHYVDQFLPLCFDHENKNIYVSSSVGRDKSALIEFDPQQKKAVNTIYEHPEADIEHIHYSKPAGKVTHAVYYTEKMHYAVLDEQFGKLKAEIDHRFPGMQVIIASHNRDETRLIINVFDDRNPGTYYYYNRITGEFIKLLDICPWLNPDHMAVMKPIQFTSRDSMTIHGYLTLPKGKVNKKGLPIVVFPHGGPWSRDKWKFHQEVQFLSNRGYGVLQVNYRGSTGYGKAFLKAGFKEWGLKIQNDITDGVKWLISEGIADSTRIGIYGFSYGGFAALSGLAFTPDLYQCGVSYAGISNIITYLENIPPYWSIQKNVLYEMVGNPELEKDMLTRASPYYSVDRIKVPVFLAIGTHDPRVNNADGYHIRDALLENGIEVIFMEKENEGHGYKNEENRLEFYRQLEQFLADHLGGRMEED